MSTVLANLPAFYTTNGRSSKMRKGIMIAVVVVIVAIAGIALDLSNTGTEKAIPNPANVTLPQSSVPQGRHISVTLSENIGIGAH